MTYYSILVFDRLDSWGAVCPEGLYHMDRDIYCGTFATTSFDVAREVILNAVQMFGGNSSPCARYAILSGNSRPALHDCDWAALDMERPVYIPLACAEDWNRRVDRLGLNRETALRLHPPVTLSAGDAAVPVSIPDVQADAIPGVRFEVRAGLNGTDRNTWSCVSDHDSGKAAGAWVADNRAIYAEAGKSLAIVKVDLSSAPSLDWMAREAGRLADGTYTPLPAPFADMVARSQPEHFAHLSQGDKRRIAFTETASAGERDRQKVLSASQYAERHLQGWFCGDRERFIAAVYGEGLEPIFVPLGDVDALVSTYLECEENGEEVASCMSHSWDNYSSRIHPVSVYALGGDITMAFLRSYGEDNCPDDMRPHDIDIGATWGGDSCGPIVARCLVWPEAKLFGRVYGCAGEARTLRSALESRGYTGSNRFDGARVGRVIENNSYVMPYLDLCSGRFSDDGDADCLRLDSDGEMSGCSTHGLVSIPVMVECDRCGSDVDEQETREVNVAEGENETWCTRCTSYHTVTCEVSYNRVPDSAVITYYNDRGAHRMATPWAISADAGREWFMAPNETNVAYSSVRYFACADCEEVFNHRDAAAFATGEGEGLRCEDCHDVHVVDSTQGNLDLDAAA
jgi:hypothetical protein